MPATATARRRRNQNPWSEGRLTVLAIVGGGLAVAAVAFVPALVAAVLFLCCTIALWPPAEHWEEGSGAMTFAIGARATAASLLHPLELFGFGPTGGDEAGLWPPTRLSAWISVAAAVPMAWLTILAGNALASVASLHPAGLRHPILNGIGAFGCAQLVAALCRHRHGQPAPAATLNRDTLEAARHTLTRAVPAGAITGLAGGLVCALVVAPRFGADIGTPAVALAALGGLIIGVLSAGAGAYVWVAGEPWRREGQLRAAWEQRWGTIARLGAPVPTFVAAHDLPQGGVPTHTQVTFQIPPGVDYQRYQPHAPALATTLGTDTVVISPAPTVDVDGLPVFGAASGLAFVVTHSLGPLGPDAHLRPGVDPATRDLAIAYVFGEAFRSLKKPQPIHVSTTSLTAEDTPGVLFETRWRLTGDLTPEDVTFLQRDIADRVQAPWLRVSRLSVTDQGSTLPSEIVSIVFGDPPDQVELRPPVAVLRKSLDRMDWDASFRACKLTGAGGTTPTLLTSATNERGILEAEFSTAPGLAVEEVRDRVPSLRATTAYGFISVETLDVADHFRILAGRTDPLAKTYLFMDYAEQILRPPQPGVSDTTWAVGVGADGELMVYNFDTELPHLLVAGSSGMGKSVLISSMICQLCHNNSPDVLELRCIEPKNELQSIRHLSHVTGFCDQQTPADSFYAAAAELLDDTVAEMDRRYALMSDPSRPEVARPKKLADARHIAAQEGPGPDGRRHPLDLPYIIVIIEECTDLFRKPSNVREQMRDWDRVNKGIDSLARKARAAGIYLVMATQHPIVQNLPSTIKQQCRRIGFGVSTSNNSIVIIDEPGLEEITTRGRAKMTYGKGYRDVRTLYLRKPDEANPDEPDDRAAILERLPKRDRGADRGGAGTPAPPRAPLPPPPPENLWRQAG
ncbi:MAG: hypothetical protein JO086_06950 [Acidimicrobiia bacterium]|nr:hypothetical protein [Acidimicrobiia bacterium]